MREEVVCRKATWSFSLYALLYCIFHCSDIFVYSDRYIS